MPLANHGEDDRGWTRMGHVILPVRFEHHRGDGMLKAGSTRDDLLDRWNATIAEKRWQGEPARLASLNFPGDAQ